MEMTNLNQGSHKDDTKKRAIFESLTFDDQAKNAK